MSTSEHLAEMDRMLRDSQLELAPDREPAAVLTASPPLTVPPPTTAPPPAIATSPPPATEDPPPPDPDPQLQAVTQLAASLLASMRELLDGYEQFLVPIRAPARPRARAAAARAKPAGDPEVAVAAGPFPSLEALREFEQAVSRLPGVRDVAVRGYEGADRAIIEVHLARPNP